MQAESAALRHLAAERVQLAHEVALARAAYGRVAGHVAHAVQVYGEADGGTAQPRGGQRGLNPRVARAYYNYIALSGFVSLHAADYTSEARAQIKRREKFLASRFKKTLALFR